jgi:hypothetical protein
MIYTLPFKFFLLIAAHFLLDFPLQSDIVAINKNRNAKTKMQESIPWWYFLTAHAFCHGLAVALITQSLWLALAETLLHFIIDFFKCEKYYSIHFDQSLHLMCKIAWIAYLL